MEKLLPNVVRTTSFCLSNSTTKSRVHFFPVAANVHGPQNVLCKLTLFGKGIERKSVVLDGGRLGQPDGLRVEDAFPVLRGDLAGLFGLEIELSTPTERVNLLSSQACVEIVSPGFSVSFFAAPFSASAVDAADIRVGQELVVGPRRRARSLVAIQDSAVSTSLVIVNGTNESLRPAVSRVQNRIVAPLQVGTVTADSAVEVSLDETLFKEASAQEVTWGDTKCEGIHFSDIPEDAVGYYTMYRDSSTKKPLSICAL